MKRAIFLLIVLSCLYGYSQTIPTSRLVDWTIAGLKDTTTVGFHVLDMTNYNVVGDSTTPNDAALAAALADITSPGAILEFPSGNFVFNDPLLLPSNLVVKGEGVGNTTLVLDMGDASHGIRIQGQRLFSDTTYFTQTGMVDDTEVMVANATSFSVGDWVQIIQNDSDLVTSSWAIQSVGQIIEIASVNGNLITFDSPFRLTYDLARKPFIQKINPAENVGIECLTIYRRTDSVMQQASNIYYNNAMNCWVKGVESDRCIFSHIEARYCSNLHIEQSYMHHAIEYGGGGRAYGVMLHFTSNECRIENNIFQHLRHSMILQAGSNGNAFAYNYSFDPYWSSTPNDAAGDMVLHGNYPFANLFEQNIAQNMVIDNSHGPNGIYNTYFRNRGGLYGIFFSANNSPSQNLIGNEIPNTGFPYNLVNYTILGTDQFTYGNNNKGTIDPVGTDALPDSTYAYTSRPAFVPESEWSKIGTPNLIGSGSIPAKDRWDSGNLFGNACSDTVVGIMQLEDAVDGIKVFPNPTKDLVCISGEAIQSIQIFNTSGQLIKSLTKVNSTQIIDVKDWPNGIYILEVELKDKKVVKRFVKD